MASSSASLNRFDVLCCFRDAWLFRGVAIDLDDAPDPKLPDPPLLRWPDTSPGVDALVYCCPEDDWLATTGDFVLPGAFELDITDDVRSLLSNDCVKIGAAHTLDSRGTKEKVNSQYCERLWIYSNYKWSYEAPLGDDLLLVNQIRIEGRRGSSLSKSAHFERLVQRLLSHHHCNHVSSLFFT